MKFRFDTSIIPPALHTNELFLYTLLMPLAYSIQRVTEAKTDPHSQ